MLTLYPNKLIIRSMNKKVLIIYHGNCRDGFTAAWAAWKKFGDEAEYVPMVYSRFLPNKLPDAKGRDVYFLDFTPEDDDLFKVVGESHSTVIIDHHESRKESIAKVPDSVYDDSHSGAVLAWKYFHPDTKVSELCLYVEDGDLWKWEIPDSDKILSYVDLKGEMDFRVWDSIAEDLESEVKRKEYIEKGSLILSFREKIVNMIIKDHAQLVSFEGHEVYAINAPRFFRSEIGNKLAEAKPPFAIVWSYTKNDINVSLRSVGFDLIPIAVKFKGGGHLTAANFRLPLGSPLPWKILK